MYLFSLRFFWVHRCCCSDIRRVQRARPVRWRWHACARRSCPSSVRQPRRHSVRNSIGTGGGGIPCAVRARFFVVVDARALCAPEYSCAACERVCIRAAAYRTNRRENNERPCFFVVLRTAHCFRLTRQTVILFFSFLNFSFFLLIILLAFFFVSTYDVRNIIIM